MDEFSGRLLGVVIIAASAIILWAFIRYMDRHEGSRTRTRDFAAAAISIIIPSVLALGLAFVVFGYPHSGIVNPGNM